LIVNNKPFHLWKYESLLEQNLFIVKVSEGAITLNDIDNMCLKDKEFYYEHLLEMKQKEKKMLESMRSGRK